jgi:hypothetical protein
MGKEDQPRYQVIESYGRIELREYESMIVAEVHVSGERKEAIRAGFKILADYIFGKNYPISENPKKCCGAKGEKIPMTAPVTQQGDSGDWGIRFTMPHHYTIKTLPKPINDQISIIYLSAKRYAVIRFSGRATDEKIQLRSAELQEFISTMRWLPLGPPILAFYNPPWTLPFLRRNEIMVEIERS